MSETEPRQTKEMGEAVEQAIKPSTTVPEAPQNPWHDVINARRNTIPQYRPKKNKAKRKCKKS